MMAHFNYTNDDTVVEADASEFGKKDGKGTEVYDKS